MYLPDMEVYPNALGSSDLRAIGWLDPAHEFTQGITPYLVINTIREIMISKRDVNKMRGFQVCWFCAEEIFGAKYVPASREEFRDYMDKTTIYLKHGSKKVLLGMSEIWIPSAAGIVYAAPSLIYHYITTHHYLLPKAFLDAVEAFSLNAEWDGKAEVERWLTYHK